MANIIEINDISAPELEVFTKLTEKQLRHKLWNRKRASLSLKAAKL